MRSFLTVSSRQHKTAEKEGTLHHRQGTGIFPCAEAGLLQWDLRGQPYPPNTEEGA